MTVRWSTFGTALRLAVHLVLLVAFGLGFVWPLVDPQAVERDPWHDHLVLGGTEAARAQALAVHRHAGLAWHDEAAPPPPLDAGAEAGEARVVVLGAHDGAGSGLFGQAAKSLALPLLLTLACLVLLFPPPSASRPLPRPSALRRLDPPPRPLPA